MAHSPIAREPGAGWLDDAIGRRETLIVCAVALGALVLRLLHFVEIEANDPFFYHPAVDPRVYHEWASRIAAGDLLGEGVFFLSPLYPYALAALYAAAGPSLFAARLCGLVVGAGTPILVYLLGKRTLGAATGALAAALWALYGPAIFYDGDLLVASLQTPLNLLMALAWARAAKTSRRRDWTLAGLLLGFSALARPNVLALAAFALAHIALEGWRESRRAAILSAIAFSAAVALVILPVTIRNFAVGGDLVLVSSQGGANFAIGNGPGATGVFRVPREFPPTRADDPIQQEAAFRRFAETESGRALAPSEVSGFWLRRTLAHIASHPAEWMHLLAVKVGLFFNADERGNSGDLETTREFSPVLRLPLPSFGLVAPLSLLGLALAWPRRRAAFPLYAFVATYLATLVAFFVLSHYRMPVVPFLALFAAHAVVRLTELLRARRFAPLAAAAVFGALLVPATRLELVEAAGRFIAHYNLGNKYRELGRDEDALAEYEKSVASNPDYISAQNNLALLAERTPEHRERAVAAWERVLELGERMGDEAYVDRARAHLRRLEGRAPAGGAR